MGKSELTKQMELEIWNATCTQGTFGCFEVTIGWYGKERVDYLTYDTKGSFRCYEIKVSVSDFHSNNHNTFVGHLNYYVMPHELYTKVKQEIPSGIGVFTSKNGFMSCEKRATRRKPLADIQVLKDSLIRSLCREVTKQIQSSDEHLVSRLRRVIDQKERETKQFHDMYWALEREVEELYGTRWRHPKHSEGL